MFITVFQGLRTASDILQGLSDYSLHNEQTEGAMGGAGTQWPDFLRVLPPARAGLGPGNLFLSQDPLLFERQWPRCLLFSSPPEQSSVGFAFAGFPIRDFPPRTEQESFKIIHEKLIAVLSAGGFAGHERLVGKVKSREGNHSACFPIPSTLPVGSPVPPLPGLGQQSCCFGWAKPNEAWQW